MHNLLIPVVAILVAAGLIVGAQAVSDAKRDERISAAIAERLDTTERVDLSHLSEVNKGYGLCGDYALPGGPTARFYYHTVTERLALDDAAPLYRDNCARLAR
ncbi:hypothetical protein [Halomonas sp. M4R1S46]|uniref:hypothetical protein n=1 Tax=Halomonas sp. M4R1S46 TaxID=2982692 RepID=UPI0021E3C1C2|nr:hypothetical protein [Halomonas sp. M4R1S46]UYG07543.1 hypothetical protein OCT48_18250 [Halomonas sp. M4R1S46]